MLGTRIVLLSTVLGMLLLWRPAAGAQTAGGSQTVEEPNQIEVITPSGGERSSRNLGVVVGRLHPALVHFPIVWLVSLAVVDLLGVGLRREFWRHGGLMVLVATMLSILPTAATGLLLAAHQDEDAAWRSLMVTHRTLNLTVAGLVALALALRLSRRNRLEGPFRTVYLGLVWLAAGLVLIAADFGGRMVYGSNYLPF